MTSTNEMISDYIKESIQTKKDILDNNIELINNIAQEIVNAYQRGNKVIWFGNGGSAADAQHLACELVCQLNLQRKALASIALTTNTSVLTAISNDYDFKHVFARQVEAIVQPHDIVIGISTSGNSLNVIKGLEAAKQLKAITIALTGSTGGKLNGNICVDYLLNVPSHKTSHIQECHIMIGHVICYIVENALFRKEINEQIISVS